MNEYTLLIVRSVTLSLTIERYAIGIYIDGNKITVPEQFMK